MKILPGLAALLAVALLGETAAHSQTIRPHRAPAQAVKTTKTVRRQPAPVPPGSVQPGTVQPGALQPGTVYSAPIQGAPVYGAPVYEGQVQQGPVYGQPQYAEGSYGGDEGVQYGGGEYGGGEYGGDSGGEYGGGEGGEMIGGGPQPPVTPWTVRSSTVPTLDYNYYYPAPGTGYQAARLYLSPRPVPGHVGYTYITYQPFAPHEQLYAHRKAYYQFYPGGLTLTKVRWSSGHHLLW